MERTACLCVVMHTLWAQCRDGPGTCGICYLNVSTPPHWRCSPLPAKACNRHLGEEAASQPDGGGDAKMGNKRLEKEWQQQVWKQRGSIGTRKSRLTTMRRALEIFEEQDVHIEGVEHLKLKHIHMLLNAFRDDDLDPRTINNHMSNLRTLLTEAGRGKFVREQLSAQQLGIERGSRMITDCP